MSCGGNRRSFVVTINHLFLDAEATKLVRLIEAVRAVRESLAQLTLTNRDSQSVEGTEAALRCLADSARPLFICQ